MSNYDQFNNNLSYKRVLGSFRKDTVDFHAGKKSLESWDKESVIEYCINDIDHILRNDDYTHKFIILKKFLRLFECNDRSEFEEKVLNKILSKSCCTYKQDFEEVQGKIGKCIFYKETFN